MTLGDHLRNLREAMDIKQVEVARQTGISNKILSSYERNVSLPSLDNLVTLCKFYKVSSDDLLQLNTASNSSAKSASQLATGAGAVLSEDQQKLLAYYVRLTDENKDAIKGMMVTYYKQQEN